MTILNVHIWPDRALVGMDTLILPQFGEPHEASKFGLLAHANLLLAWRGDLTLNSMIFHQCLATQGAMDFDKIESGLADLIPRQIEHVRVQLVALGLGPEVLDSPHFRSIEMALVGWSASRNRMWGKTFRKSPDEPKIDVTDIDSWSIAPGEILESHEVTIPSSIGALEKLARAQYDAARARGIADQGFGGQLLIAELTRTEFRVRRKNVFPPNPVGTS